MHESYKCLNISHGLAMAPKMEYDIDSPLSYDVEAENWDRDVPALETSEKTRQNVVHKLTTTTKP